ncbi:CheY-like chemotaxis protein [Aquimarina sp. EL_43]|uniref:response regulator n=1 Tax=Aquimarina TaxID=290174 RepID=UPI0004713DDD|nr:MULTISPECIES: response regulator [Aquimarina]MBG6133158.1 CheY-like chemotaxis protein [Aquimarina sp. EL_35]MBG6153316.1 CheY-like chemotaxis protein [Aquimarina sp. EL_32]MBG6171415.1 CheY-like chemotaxis protein [Aquimarina sp. EL_43]
MSHKIGLACIIDDDNMYVNLVKRIVEAKNLCNNLMVFQNGKDALNYFEAILTNLNKKTIPEIIFLDLNMPVMDGWEFLDNFTKIKNKLGKTITLYIVSSSINPVDIERAKSINTVKDYLIKPVTIEDLEAIFLKQTL